MSDEIERRNCCKKSGLAKILQKDFIGAISGFTKAIEINPLYGEAYNNKGSAKGMIQDYLGSIIDSTKAIVINPNNAATFYNRALTKCRLKDYPDAINDLSETIRINPKHASAYFNRGVVKLILDQNNGGLLDLYKTKYYGDEKAGEVIKKHCDQKTVYCYKLFEISSELFISMDAFLKQAPLVYKS